MREEKRGAVHTGGEGEGERSGAHLGVRVREEKRGAVHTGGEGERGGERRSKVSKH